jgi:hypothetical protein
VGFDVSGAGPAGPPLVSRPADRQRRGDAATARRREIGSALRRHIERGIIVARELEEAAPYWVHRVDTGDRTVAGIAAEIIGLTGWMAER